MLHRFVIGLLVGAPFVLLSGDGTIAAHKDMTEIRVTSAIDRPVEVSITGAVLMNVPRSTNELLVSPVLQTYSRDHDLQVRTPVTGTADLQTDSLVIRAEPAGRVRVALRRWRGETHEATGRVITIVRQGDHIAATGSDR